MKGGMAGLEDGRDWDTEEGAQDAGWGWQGSVSLSTAPWQEAVAC